MTEQLRQRHQELHRALDELLACFMEQCDGPVTQFPIRELLEFSYAQTQNPTCKAKGVSEDGENSKT